MKAAKSPFTWMIAPVLLLMSVVGGIWPHGTASAQEVAVAYLVNHGRHVGLVVPRTDATAAYWPEQDDFPEAVFLEVGWGERAYYQDPDPGLGTALKGALVPTPSVLHIVGFERPVEAYFRGMEIILLDLSRAGADSLAAFIHAAYARDDEGRALVLGPGLYGESRFYAGRERYHVFRNCNRWAARALRAAGLGVRPSEVLTAGDLCRQARPLGVVIQRPG